MAEAFKNRNPHEAETGRGSFAIVCAQRNAGQRASQREREREGGQGSGFRV